MLRQNIEFTDVDFFQLLSASDPGHLRLLCVQLQTIAAHPCYNALDADRGFHHSGLTTGLELP